VGVKGYARWPQQSSGNGNGISRQAGNTDSLGRPRVCDRAALSSLTASNKYSPAVATNGSRGGPPDRLQWRSRRAQPVPSTGTAALSHKKAAPAGRPRSTETASPLPCQA